MPLSWNGPSSGNQIVAPAADAKETRPSSLTWEPDGLQASDGHLQLLMTTSRKFLNKFVQDMAIEVHEVRTSFSWLEAPGCLRAWLMAASSYLGGMKGVALAPGCLRASSSSRLEAPGSLRAWLMAASSDLGGMKGVALAPGCLRASSSSFAKLVESECIPCRKIRQGLRNLAL